MLVMIGVHLLKHTSCTIPSDINSLMCGVVEHIIIDAYAREVSNNFARICVERDEPRWPSASKEYLMIRFVERQGVLHARLRHGPPCDHLACLQVDDSNLSRRSKLHTYPLTQ